LHPIEAECGGLNTAEDVTSSYHDCYLRAAFGCGFDFFSVLHQAVRINAILLLAH
jgi:hypothetical protein